MIELNNAINKLKLFGIRASIECRLSEAIKDNLTYQDFITLLFEDELIYRENRRSVLLKNRAKFRDRVCLEEFEAAPARGVNKSMIKMMQSLQFLNDNENIIFYGSTGSGKSFLAQAIGHATCIAGKETIFVSVNVLLRQLEAAEKSGTYLAFMARLTKASLVILDDFGLRNYTHQEANALFQLLEDRYHKASTIVTSQVQPNGWKTLFEDQVIAEAIIDRLKSCAHIIEVKSGAADTYRKNHAPKKAIKVDDQK